MVFMKCYMDPTLLICSYPDRNVVVSLTLTSDQYAHSGSVPDFPLHIEVRFLNVQVTPHQLHVKRIQSTCTLSGTV